jgi:hypothetical protein
MFMSKSFKVVVNLMSLWGSSWVDSFSCGSLEDCLESVQQDAISRWFLGVRYYNYTIVLSYHPDVVEGHNTLTHQGEAPLRCMELKILGHSLFASGVQPGDCKA